MGVFDKVLKAMREQEGALIEIWIDDTDLNDWERCVSALGQIADAVEFRIDGQKQEFTGVARAFSQSGERAVRIAFTIEKQTWTTLFFEVERIDFQGDPRDVRTVADVRGLERVLELLKNATGKRACLYSEGAHDMVDAPPLMCTD